MSYVDLESLWDNSQATSSDKPVEKYIEIAPGVCGRHGRERKGGSED
jgi:hypothetical protein